MKRSWNQFHLISCVTWDDVDFLTVLTQDNTFYMDTKLPRFTSLVNLGDKRENTDAFVPLSSNTLIAHLILTLCLIPTFPWDRSRKNPGNTITFVQQNSKIIFGMCSRTVYCTVLLWHLWLADQLPSPEIHLRAVSATNKSHFLGVEVKMKNRWSQGEKHSELNSAQIYHVLFFFGIFHNFRTLITLLTQEWII